MKTIIGNLVFLFFSAIGSVILFIWSKRTLIGTFSGSLLAAVVLIFLPLPLANFVIAQPESGAGAIVAIPATIGGMCLLATMIIVWTACTDGFYRELFPRTVPNA